MNECVLPGGPCTSARRRVSTCWRAASCVWSRDVVRSLGHGFSKRKRQLPAFSCTFTNSRRQRTPNIHTAQSPHQRSTTHTATRHNKRCVHISSVVSDLFDALKAAAHVKIIWCLRPTSQSHHHATQHRTLHRKDDNGRNSTRKKNKESKKNERKKKRTREERETAHGTQLYTRTIATIACCPRRAHCTSTSCRQPAAIHRRPVLHAPGASVQARQLHCRKRITLHHIASRRICCHRQRSLCQFESVSLRIFHARSKTATILNTKTHLERPHRGPALRLYDYRRHSSLRLSSSTVQCSPFHMLTKLVPFAS